MTDNKKLSLNQLSKAGLSFFLLLACGNYMLLYSPEHHKDEISSGLILTAAVCLFYLFSKKVVLPLQNISEEKLLTEVHQESTGPQASIREFSRLKETLASFALDTKNATFLVKEIEAGKLDTDLSAILNNTGKENAQNSHLVTSLLKLRSQMKKIGEEEKERRWTNEGLTKFIEILRSQDNDLKALTDRIISQLVKYLEANQGAFYIAEDEADEPYLQLTSCYAFNRKKFVDQRIQIGEGMVGQAYLEKDHILITDVPDHYLKITSGLGESNPKCILIVPVILNDEVLGVVELASFREFAPYQVDFIKKLCENIASTISTVKVNDKTGKLLDSAQQTAEELKAQEEELRQNMEELEATQEEMHRKQQELEQIKVVLEKKNFEIEEISRTEKERADAKIETQKKSMMKAIETYKAKEDQLRAKLKQQEEEINRILQSSN